MDEFAAYLGIDWLDQKHDLCLIDSATGKKESSILTHSPEAIDDWAIRLHAHFSGQRVAVCLEQSRGPLIFAPMKYDFLVLYPINPSTLASYREAFSPSGAKDVPTDADYMAEIVCTHRDRLRAWLPEDEKTRRLRISILNQVATLSYKGRALSLFPSPVYRPLPALPIVASARLYTAHS